MRHGHRAGQQSSQKAGPQQGTAFVEGRHDIRIKLQMMLALAFVSPRAPSSTYLAPLLFEIRGVLPKAQWYL